MTLERIQGGPLVVLEGVVDKRGEIRVYLVPKGFGRQQSRVGDRFLIFLSLSNKINY